MDHSNHWYRIRLGRYFNEHYGEYEENVLWWNDPAPNQWLFDIPEEKIRIELTCDDKERITAQHYILTKEMR